MGKKRVMILENSPVVVAGIERMLSESGSFEVVKIHSDTEHIFELVLSRKPNVILINPGIIGLPVSHFLSSLRRQSPDIVLLALVYSFYDDSILSHFDKVIDISFDQSKLVAVINSLLNHPARDRGTENGELSDRENEVVALVAKGSTNKEIADLLKISIHTVITHRKNISRKTGIKSISGLTVYAMLNKLI